MKGREQLNKCHWIEQLRGHGDLGEVNWSGLMSKKGVRKWTQWCKPILILFMGKIKRIWQKVKGRCRTKEYFTFKQAYLHDWRDRNKREDMQTNWEIRDLGTRRCNLMEKCCSTSWDPRHKMCFINVKSHLFMETRRKEVKPGVIWITQRCGAHRIMSFSLFHIGSPWESGLPSSRRRHSEKGGGGRRTEGAVKA